MFKPNYKMDNYMYNFQLFHSPTDIRPILQMEKQRLREVEYYPKKIIPRKYTGYTFILTSESRAHSPYFSIITLNHKSSKIMRKLKETPFESA